MIDMLTPAKIFWCHWCTGVREFLASFLNNTIQKFCLLKKRFLTEHEYIQTRKGYQVWYCSSAHTITLCWGKHLDLLSLLVCRWNYWTCTSSGPKRPTAIAAVPRTSLPTVNGARFHLDPFCVFQGIAARLSAFSVSELPLLLSIT